MEKNLLAMQEMWETGVQSLGWEKSPGEGNSNPLQYSCLENFTDRGAYRKESDTTEHTHTHGSCFKSSNILKS